MNTGYKPKVVSREEVDAVGVLPDKLILVALKLISPSKHQLRAHILHEGWLEIIKLPGEVGTVIDSQRVVSCQFDLFKLEINGFVDPLHEF